MVIAAVIITGSAVRSGHTFKALILTALQGVASIFAVNLLSNITGVTLPFNQWTLGISALGGMPGVVTMLLMNRVV